MRLFTQQTRAGVEVTTAALFAGHCFLLLRLKIGEIGLAIRAADRLEMKIDVRAGFLLQDAQKIAAELAARNTGQPLPSPNGADRMLTPIALLHEPAQVLP